MDYSRDIEIISFGYFLTKKPTIEIYLLYDKLLSERGDIDIHSFGIFITNKTYNEIVNEYKKYLIFNRADNNTIENCCKNF